MRRISSSRLHNDSADQIQERMRMMKYYKIIDHARAEQ